MNTSYLNAYLDMVGALTTTGLRVLRMRACPSLHFWRAFVAWCGGALIWIAAGAIFAPLNIGGYEVLHKPATRSAGGYGLTPRKQRICSTVKRESCFPSILV